MLILILLLFPSFRVEKSFPLSQIQSCFYSASASIWKLNRSGSVKTVRTMEELDQGSLRPLLEHLRKSWPCRSLNLQPPAPQAGPLAKSYRDSQCCGSGMIFCGSGSDFSQSFWSDPRSGSDSGSGSCMKTYKHTQISTHIYTHTHTQTYTNTNTHTYTHAHTHYCLYVTVI
jgi:hypothetical protein